MPKYTWEATPHLTRPDVFADGTEIGHKHFPNDEVAIEWLERTFERHSHGNAKLSMKLTIGSRTVRAMKWKAPNER